MKQIKDMLKTFCPNLETKADAETYVKSLMAILLCIGVVCIGFAIFVLIVSVA